MKIRLEITAENILNSEDTNLVLKNITKLIKKGFRNGTADLDDNEVDWEIEYDKL